MTPWPCTTCGAVGVRNVGTRGYCATHISDLYRSFAPQVWTVGIGVLAGVARPEHGPEFHELACVACDATWVGPLFESCWWCERALAVQQDAQAVLALTAPDCDPADARWAGAMEAWRGRLRRAVEAELITATQAERAWDRTRGTQRAA